MKKVIIFTLGLLFVASCSNDNDNIVKRLAQEPATVREVKGANNLFVFELPNNDNGLYSQYVVPSGALPAEYKEDGLQVFISGDVTSNYVAIDGYISESKENYSELCAHCDSVVNITINLNGNYNIFELRTMVADENDYSNIANLYEQPLPVIQKCVQGKWQKKGTHGGLAGWLPELDNVFVEISGNKFNENEFQWKNYTVKNPDGSSFKTYAIQYVGFDEPSLYFQSIKNDSLMVGYPYKNCYDCFTGALWVRFSSKN